MLTQAQVERMRCVPAFANGPSSHIEPDRALDYHRRKYVVNLKRYCDVRSSILLDCGCSMGWLVLAFLLEGGKKAIGIDLNEQALRAASEFAGVLGLKDRAQFCRASVTALPLAYRSVDASTCIETLEHLHGDADGALSEIARVTRNLALVATPNKLFPVIAHDSRLPLAHWMPAGLRKHYVRLFRRSDCDEGNTFVSPLQVKRNLSGFRLVSRFLGFASFSDFAQCYPHYLPYPGAGRERNLPRSQGVCYSLIDNLCGSTSFYLLPSLTGIFQRVK